MEYSSAFASHQPLYAPNFGNPSAEHLHQHYQQQQYTLAQSSIPDQNTGHYPTAVVPHQIACDIKPRLTKEQHDILEAHYSEQTKPNTSTKKGFAESLNVSLDKVNNWFQNRRAKSKQDARKAQNAQQALNESQQNPPQVNNSSGSDSEPSPAFASSDYFNMMQQCNAENNINNDFGGLPQGSFEGSASMPMAMPMPSAEPSDQFQSFNFDQPTTDLFESSQDLNRRTLTQEQFNAMSQQSVLQGSNGFGMDMDTEAFNKMYPGFDHPDEKADATYDFQAYSNQGSSIPDTNTEQPAMSFPSSNAMQARSVTSSASSDWGGSRSSSVSTLSREGHVAQPSGATQSQACTSSQWRPGQSVPVDFNQLSEEFRQIARAQQPQQYLQEQPLAWPIDGAFDERRSSSTAAITQSLGNVGLKTPQPQQHAAFKSPTPATSLAARRQRSKPAPLGLASLRSQSYSAGSQPGSPGQMSQSQQHQHHGNPVPAQPLRRIKSSNMINGVAQGRIQKPNPGSSQRSPLNFSFQEAMNSPKGTRHLSSHNGSSLVPPTPLSPREYARVDAKQMQQWQSSSGQVSRQASISENDIEQNVPHVAVVPGVSDNFSSPPHTPLYPPQPQFAQQRVGKHIITENTPPQSAPATQISFASSFMPPPPQAQPTQHQPTAMPPPPTSQQSMQDMFPSFATATMGPEPQFPIGDMSMGHQPQFTLTASEPMTNPQMHYPLMGAPMVDPHASLQMAMAQPHYQLVPHQPPNPPASAPPLDHTPPMHYPFPATNAHSAGLQMNSHASKPAPQPELFVHEYQPPADVKRAVTPRKVAADGPKNYTFANQTPEHFLKGKKATAATSHSPTGSSS